MVEHAPNLYFHSATNPIANADQCAAEEQALRIFRSADLHDAIKRIGFLWRLAYGENVGDQARDTFEEAMHENAFNYLLKAVASDGNYPRPVRVFMPSNVSFGREIPGSRMGGDNPDNCYRLIGIHPGVRYEVFGRPMGKVAASVSFTLVANYGTSQTIQGIDFDDLRKEPDGSFTLVIDGDPADGRTNHLRTGPAVKFLYIRDSMNDWVTETPLALTVRRIDSPTAAALTDGQITERAVKAMVEEVPLYYWFTRLCSGRAMNSMVEPDMSASLGGLVTQASSQGWFRLTENDAFVITLDAAGAKYFSFVAYDWWFRSIEYWQRTSSLTQGQMKPDPDGRYTVVLSRRDPGVHNWIDPGDQREVLAVARWQGLPRMLGERHPTLHVQTTTFSELSSVLPEGYSRISPDGRRSQQQQRRTSYERRLVQV